jgi:biopolymer transport protein ExbD
MARERQALPDKIAIDMTPMIDVVFQLITFFMLTLKDVAVEGDFDIKMPLGPAQGAVADDLIPPLRITMRASAAGGLAAVTLNDAPVIGQEALEALAGAEAMLEQAGALPAGEARSKQLKIAQRAVEQAAAPFVDSLRRRVVDIVGTGPGSNADQAEVELDCDYGLKYDNVVRAITAVSGMVQPDGTVIELVKKIKFTPPKKPQ